MLEALQAQVFFRAGIEGRSSGIQKSVVDLCVDMSPYTTY